MKYKKYVLLYTCLYYNTNLVLCEVMEATKLLKPIRPRKILPFLSPLQLVYFDLSYQIISDDRLILVKLEGLTILTVFVSRAAANSIFCT